MLAYSSRSQHSSPGRDHRKQSLDKRLAVLFWPLLLILIGAIWLFPANQVPGGTWLVGVGLILLGLNVARVVNGIPARLLPTVLGVVALVGGLAQFAGVDLPLVPLSFIAIGTSIVLELLHSRTI